MEGVYTEHKPAAPLDRYVHRMLYAYFPFPLPPEQLAPDSYLKLTFILDGEPQYYDGKGDPVDWHDGFAGHVPPERGLIATSNGPVRCVAVNFYPSAAYRLFGRPLHLFNGRMVKPAEVLGDRVDKLYTDLRSAEDPQRMFGLIEDMLMERLAALDDEGPTLMEQLEAVTRVSKGMIQINELARSVGLSERQLQRRAFVEIGLSPKEFSRVVRFNHVYSHMQRTRMLDLEIALSCGYFDESHMMKDLAYFLGDAPKRFAALVRPMVDGNLGH